MDGQEAGANAKILTEMLFGTKGRNATTGEVYEALGQSAEIARNLNSLVQSCAGLQEGEKIAVKFGIQQKWPDLDLDKAARTDLRDIRVVPTGWFCTRASIEAKRAELDHIEHVDLPDTAKEIADAKAKGDLRENSEFQYAKDKRHLLQEKQAKLKEELDKAIVVDLSTVDPTKTGFGTKVGLTDMKSGEKLSYTIMGPWESDPEAGVINILAPLGGELCNHKVGEEFTFTLGDTSYTYRVDSIEVVKEA